MTPPVPPPVHPVLRYRNYGAWLRERLGFPAVRVGVDGGFSCPNRDGRRGSGGCLFCDNDAFTPAIRHPGLPVGEQVRRGIAEALAGRLRRAADPGRTRFLAYFQRYSNTDASPEALRRSYREALLAHPQVAGIVVGTRPDCLPPGVLDLLAEIARERYLMVEVGLQSASDAVLSGIGRGHTVREFETAVRALRARGIDTGVHLIHGLPGDTRDGFVAAAPYLSGLDIQGVKVHHFHVTAGSRAEAMWREGRLPVPDCREHVEACADFLAHLSPEVAVLRLAGDAPEERLLAPRWGIGGAEVARRVSGELARRGEWQGARARGQRAG